MLSIQVFSPNHKEKKIKHHPSCVCSLCLSVPAQNNKFKEGDRVIVRSSRKEGVVEWVGGTTVSVLIDDHPNHYRSNVRYLNLDDIILIQP